MLFECILQRRARVRAVPALRPVHSQAHAVVLLSRRQHARKHHVSLHHRQLHEGDVTTSHPPLLHNKVYILPCSRTACTTKACGRSCTVSGWRRKSRSGGGGAAPTSSTTATTSSESLTCTCLHTCTYNSIGCVCWRKSVLSTSFIDD